LPLKESDIPVAVNPKSADGPSNNPQCGFWDSQFSAAQVKSVEQPWGAVHAATLGHGKTIATTYLVGVRGKPIDAVILGIFVTLSHTSGIVVVGVLGSPGSAWLMAGQMEMYLALAVGVLAPTHFQAKPQEC
jgi:hypothetical protein